MYKCLRLVYPQKSVGAKETLLTPNLRSISLCVTGLNETEYDNVWCDSVVIQNNLPQHQHDYHPSFDHQADDPFDRQFYWSLTDLYISLLLTLLFFFFSVFWLSAFHSSVREIYLSLLFEAVTSTREKNKEEDGGNDVPKRNVMINRRREGANVVWSSSSSCDLSFLKNEQEEGRNEWWEKTQHFLFWLDLLSGLHITKQIGHWTCETERERLVLYTPSSSPYIFSCPSFPTLSSSFSFLSLINTSSEPSQPSVFSSLHTLCWWFICFKLVSFGLPSNKSSPLPDL